MMNVERLDEIEKLLAQVRRYTVDDDGYMELDARGDYLSYGECRVLLDAAPDLLAAAREVAGLKLDVEALMNSITKGDALANHQANEISQLRADLEAARAEVQRLSSTWRHNDLDDLP
jgi:hypothetical protein